MLRLVELVEQDHSEAGGSSLDSNQLLRQALERITLCSPACKGPFILDEVEAEALSRALCHLSFTPDQLAEWVRRLQRDPPYDRRRPGSGRRGLFHRLFRHWRDTEEEPLDQWERRAKRFVQEQIASVADRRWLEAPLERLEQARMELSYQTHKSQWTMVVMRWALVHLLTIPPHDAGAWTPRATTG